MVWLTAVLAAEAQTPAASPGRRALLLVNANYPSIAAIPAATAGSAALQPVLRQMRFDLRVVENANLEQIDAAISKLASETLPGDVALVFYLGLAVQSSQENYLLPANFDPAKTKGVDYEAYSMRRFAGLIEERQPAFFGLVVDAAWDLPVLRQRFPDSGLVLQDPNRPGALFAMSASPGKAAGDGSRSLYAQALADALRREGLTLNQIVDLVKRSVVEASGGSQMPTEISTVVRDFYVNPKPADVLAWEGVRDSQDAAAIRGFVEAHPGSRFVSDANARLEDLDWKQASGKDVAALRGFLTRYPNTRQRAAAQSEIDLQLALDTLRRYKAAMESRDLNLMKEVWPGLTKQQMASFQGFFRDAKSIQVEGNPVGTPAVQGSTATIRAKRSIQLGQSSTNDVVVLKLKKNGEGMIIEGFAMEKLQ
jgi:uncharacterized caspase-like protein